MIVVNTLISKKSVYSVDQEYFGDSVHTWFLFFVESGKYDKSGYPSEYGDHGDSHETYNSGESNHCGDSDGFCGSDESD